MKLTTLSVRLGFPLLAALTIAVAWGVLARDPTDQAVRQPVRAVSVVGTWRPSASLNAAFLDSMKRGSLRAFVRTHEEVLKTLNARSVVLQIDSSLHCRTIARDTGEKIFSFALTSDADGSLRPVGATDADEAGAVYRLKDGLLQVSYATTTDETRLYFWELESRPR